MSARRRSISARGLARGWFLAGVTLFGLASSATAAPPDGRAPTPPAVAPRATPKIYWAARLVRVAARVWPAARVVRGPDGRHHIVTMGGANFRLRLVDGPPRVSERVRVDPVDGTYLVPHAPATSPDAVDQTLCRALIQIAQLRGLAEPDDKAPQRACGAVDAEPRAAADAGRPPRAPSPH